MQNIVNVNSQITALMIVALGQFIVALIGGIDISVGSVVSLTSVLIVLARSVARRAGRPRPEPGVSVWPMA